MTLIEVRPQHAFDPQSLQRWLTPRLPAASGPLRIRQFAGGQSNPTYLVETPDGQGYVLRRKPPGVLLPSAHAIEREHRVMSALAGSAVPVPRMLALCEDPEVIGSAFFVMEQVAGRIFWDPRLPELEVAERGAIYDELNRVIAALHQIELQATGLGDYGRTGSYLARQLDRWTRQYRASETEPIAAMDRLIAWLPAHAPQRDETTLVHGDYRLDNVIFHPTEPRILAVLDWELSTLGDPLADLAYHLMFWRLAPDEFRGLAGEDLTALGIPDEAAYLAAYRARTGRAPQADWDFYVAFNAFRLAAILQGVFKRSLHGNAADATAHQTGQRARAIAEAGWRQAERVVG